MKMNQDFQDGQMVERARHVRWLVERAQSSSELARKQRAIGEPAAAINEAYARAFRSVLTHITEDEASTEPTPVTTAA
jgi:hypothetical protein